jgi:hypothetical protein
VRRWSLVLGLCAALLFGCEGGPLSDYSQSCTSTGGFLSGRTVTCSGQAQSLSGSVRIEFGDDEDELSGTYWLAAEISVDRGEARVYSYDADGERFPLDTVSVRAPLRVEEVVIEPFNDSSVFFINAGEGEIEDLRYEGRIEPV